MKNYGQCFLFRDSALSELFSFVYRQQLMNQIISSKFVWWIFQVYSNIYLSCKRSEAKHFSIQELTFVKRS